MSKYEILWVADENNRRDYRDRQLYANSKGAVAYVAGHHNSKVYTVDVDGDGVADMDSVGLADNPTMVIVCDNASRTSQEMGSYFAKECSKAFKVPLFQQRGHLPGLRVLKRGDRAYFNLYYTKMKAVLLEPLWVSDGELAMLAQSEDAQDKIAKIIENMIRKFFPNGGLIAFDVGHLYKASSRLDRGAPVVGTGGRVGEADLVLPYMRKAAALLEGTAEKTPPKEEESAVYSPDESVSTVVLSGRWELDCSGEGGTVLTRL